MLWVETPSNPLLRITDLRPGAKTLGHPRERAAGGGSTPSSPLPCSGRSRSGADIVVHSTT
jgi:cystathionine beta-lyase/cystathionine gamma-synthase